VEMGAGDGRLLRDVLGWAARARPEFAAALRLLLIEPDLALRDAQQRTLAHLDASPRWVERLDDLEMESITGCFISNELIDSFPVRLFVVEQGLLAEVGVALRQGSLVEIEGVGPTVTSPGHLRSLIELMPDGARIELNEGAAQWMAEVAKRLRRGFVLTFDYGYPAAQMYVPWRTQGTLMAFYRHSVSQNLLAHPGEQDLTAHVDFTALATAGIAHGLDPIGFTSQREFLTTLGIHEAVSAPGLPLEETLARRRAVLTLTDSAGLGRVRVLAQAKGMEASGLSGFAGSPPIRTALDIDG
jgi:SAM-dependent MidA family methyltransferase